MASDKFHWYDGWFYDRWIAPHQDEMFARIREIIEPQSSVLDVGCGTGRLAFLLADTCDRVLGIDLSSRNVATARLVLSKHSRANVAFSHTTASELLSAKTDYFDYAVLTYVLHEVPIQERVQLLRDIAGLARTIIIGDYLVPQPAGLLSVFNEMVEFAAGRDHYRNYKAFTEHGGIGGIVSTLKFRVVKEIRNSPRNSHIVVLQSHNA
ncbi:MAG: class I SAM-dependent methyltransferase [Bacteroidetes bacterium]|nr:class I SAM-dependent methyltransferase [Bacteroidota bacterium]MCW5897530.1 class I SAM-dependent methyltransferase [Bacteroidota bacterium]